MDEHTAERPSVVFINRFYWPDIAATGQILTELAEALAALGFQVRVITGRASYHGRQAQARRDELHNGVEIRRPWSTRFGRERMWGRVTDYASFYVSAAIAATRAPRGSVFVGLTDPPLIFAVALLAARARGGRAAYWVQDLFPDIAAAVGLLRENSLVLRAAKWLSRRLMQSADSVVTLGPAMRAAAIRSGARSARVEVIENWADVRSIVPVTSPGNPYLDAQGLRDRFVVMYSGNAGRVHTFDAVMRAMDELRDDATIVFAFVGGGARTREIRDFVERRKLGNVRFFDYAAKAELKYSLSAATVSLVTENPRVVGLVVPSKTYGIMASGRPLVFVGSPDSDVATLIRRHECGVIVTDLEGIELADRLRELRSAPDRVAAMGARAREAAENAHDRQHAVEKWAATLRRISGKKG